MKIYRAHELSIEPVIMLAENETEAIAKFHWAILKGFGFWPNLSFAIDIPNPSDLPLGDELLNLRDEDLPGFAAMTTDGWEYVPFT